MALLLSTALAACAVGPNYKRPAVTTSPNFKEAEGWTPAQPADGVAKGDWWAVFGDPVLDGLERKVLVSNQNLAAAEAAYREARALVAEDRAGLFPTVDLTGSATRSGRNAPATPGAPKASNSFQASLGATWAVDVWGRIRRSIEGAKASAQASAADLANARLTAQSELAAARVLQDEEHYRVEAAQEAVQAAQIALNQYRAGQVAYTSVVVAQATALSARQSLVTLQGQRLAAAVSLIEALGGGWSTADLPK